MPQVGQNFQVSMSRAKARTTSRPKRLRVDRAEDRKSTKLTFGASLPSAPYVVGVEIALTSSIWSSIAGRNSKQTSVEPQDVRKAREVRIVHLRRVRNRSKRLLGLTTNAAAMCEGRLNVITKLILGSAALLSGLMAANGIFMLVAPLDWYMSVPGVTTTGPFNQHFLRDIGLIFLLNSFAFAVGAAKPEYRRTLWCSATLWLSAHALFHVWEVAVGICEPSALIRDFAAVSSPALVGALLTLWSFRRAGPATKVSQGRFRRAT